MKKTILVYGAGAIGRGYLPWVFSPDEFDFMFVDRNPDLVESLRRRGSYTTFRTKDGKYEKQQVPVAGAFLLGEEKSILQKTNALCLAVGPRNVVDVAHQLSGVSLPIIAFENDSSVPEIVSSITGNKRVYFGIPDVITSNTAPEQLLRHDPLSIVTEDGTCFVDNRAGDIGGQANYIDVNELNKQWIAKLYIHNTPHCVTAYLGALMGKKYVHEAMAVEGAARIVRGTMEEMVRLVTEHFGVELTFARWYADKELSRFANHLLFDPVSRVAREPFRKLAPAERLIGAANLALSRGILPKHLSAGIMAAFFYNEGRDADAHIRHLIGALSPNHFLEIILKLPPSTALHNLLLAEWGANSNRLASLS